MVGWLLLLAPIGLLLIRALPSQSWWPAAQVVGALPWTFPVALTATVLGILAALAAARRRAAGGLTLVGLVVTVALGALLAPRAVPSDLSPATATGDQDEVFALRVLAVNGFVGRVDARQVTSVVREEAVDVLCVSESTPALQQDLIAAGLANDLTHRVDHSEPGASGTTIWSRLPLTEVPSVEGTTFRMPRATVQLGSQVITVTCVHTNPPLRSTMAAWDRDLRAVGDAVASTGGPQIVLGDFNATWEHRLLRQVADAGSLHDAAQSAGIGLTPTWPSDGNLLPWPTFTLDHVLTDLPVQDAWIYGLSGSDHMAVGATLEFGSR